MKARAKTRRLLRASRALRSVTPDNAEAVLTLSEAARRQP